MSSRTHLATLAGSAPGQRLEVSLVPGRDGRLAIELRQQHFADGIGWFDQRSMQVDPAQLRQIQAVLGSGNLPVPDGLEEPRAIIPFPGPSSSVPQRPAMGE